MPPDSPERHANAAASVSAHVLSRPVFSDGYVRFLERSGQSWRQDPTATDAEQIIEFAGRVCYMSFGERQSSKSNADYIAHLIKEGHESVLEHVNWTFILSNISRSFTHQLVRHRVGFAYSQLSQQYYDHASAGFIEPTILELFPEAQAAWLEVTEAALQAYRKIAETLTDVDGKIPAKPSQKECLRALHSAARSILPNATETVIVVTANARALRHFFKVRGAIEGDEEMRGVASAILEAIRPDAPAVFFDFTIGRLADGSTIVRHRPPEHR